MSGKHSGRGISELFKAQMMQGQEYNLSVIQAKEKGDKANKNVKVWRFFPVLQSLELVNGKGWEIQIKHKLWTLRHSEYKQDMLLWFPVLYKVYKVLMELSFNSHNKACRMVIHVSILQMGQSRLRGHLSQEHIVARC